MELIIKEKQPTICLNMIVKNESHIIEKTLEMICSKLLIAYWVICDTGSTDNTVEIIERFFTNKNIPGVLHNHEWKNFAHNRTLALNEAFDKTDLLFVFDADDEIHGELIIPSVVDCDGYYINFGDKSGLSYRRMLLVNNRIKWVFKSVIHEYIECLKTNPLFKPIHGDYYVVSGRNGSRNNDPNKYLNDAKILEAAYHEARFNNDTLYLRYGFYCANSYKDAGKVNDAIKWYKITLQNDNWVQEKYMCCYHLYLLYLSKQQSENGIPYLIESIKYDNERAECLFMLIQDTYVNKHDAELSYQYYTNIRDFYETRFLKETAHNKLFVEVDKPNFLLPYYMIIIADKVKDKIPEANTTIIKMFEIIFTKKYYTDNDFFIGNVLYNLQFFIEQCYKCLNFIELFQSYIYFLEANNRPLYKYDFLHKYEKYGIVFKSIHPPNVFLNEKCKNSNKILFFAGFSSFLWNYTYSLNNSLGGSETSLSNIAKCFPSNFEIYVCGTVSEEQVDNVRYISLETLKKMEMKNTLFYSVIVSRYISFYELFPKIACHSSYIWAHDIKLFNYGCNTTVKDILLKWNDKITGCVCQTEWHKNLFNQEYPELNSKIFTINNGISVDKFNYKPIKTTNRFVYTSCSERGLDRLVELWPTITEKLPDAELIICSYNQFPNNENVYEVCLNDKIKSYNNIKHVGSLNKSHLYSLMASAEFWLYPTCFNETSCITAMEMLMSEVICVYYPVAGLNDTIGDYGIPVSKNNEVDTIMKLTKQQMSHIKKRGKEYALTCSYKHRVDEWLHLIKMSNLHPNDNLWIFYAFDGHNFKVIEDYINSLKQNHNIVYTKDVNFILSLKQLPKKISYIMYILDERIIHKYKNTNVELSFLNTEPLSISYNLNLLKTYIMKYPYLKIYDYSFSNLQTIVENINGAEASVLDYTFNKDENDILEELYLNTKKVFDFGIITYGNTKTNSINNLHYNKKEIVTELIKNGFNIHIISGWGLERDVELAKCKIILNIHSVMDRNGQIYTSKTFENIRCIRLLNAGFKVLSEDSLYQYELTNQYNNLKFLNYDSFKNIKYCENLWDTLN